MRTTTDHRSETGAELYQSFFVPTIAGPMTGELVDAAALQPGERVLDVACGTGVVARAAAERVGPTGTVTGIDLAPDMLEVAEAIPAAGAPIAWHQGDAAALPLPDAAYDVALCQLGLMFVPDKPAALAELHRVLVPGGRVVMSTPGAVQPPFAALETAISDTIGPDVGAVLATVFSMDDPAQLAGLLEGSGFTEVSTSEYRTVLTLPRPEEFLWAYIGVTPLAPLVVQAPASARTALERRVVEDWAPWVVDDTVPVHQPMVLATARRT